MIAEVLRDMDADRTAFMPFYEAGFVGQEEIDRYIDRQEARLKLAHGAIRTAEAMEFVEAVDATIEKL